MSRLNSLKQSVFTVIVLGDGRRVCAAENIETERVAVYERRIARNAYADRRLVDRYHPISA